MKLAVLKAAHAIAAAVKVCDPPFVRSLLFVRLFIFQLDFGDVPKLSGLNSFSPKA